MSGQDYEQLTLFQGDSLASRSVQPGSAEAVRMTVTSGLRCLELSKNSAPLGLLVKMLLESSTWHSTLYYLTWKASATPCKRLLFRLVPSMPSTGGTDARLWPTPRANKVGGYSIDERDEKVYLGWKRNRKKRGLDPDWYTSEERAAGNE